MNIKLGMNKAITVVIGGGLAGLATAGTLSKQGLEVVLIESKGKIGVEPHLLWIQPVAT